MAESVFKKECSSNTDDQDIANCFKQTFSDCCFDSYDDTENVSELFGNLSWSVFRNNTFNVLDVEKALGKLKIGKATGFDGVVKEQLKN